MGQREINVAPTGTCNKIAVLAGAGVILGGTKWNRCNLTWNKHYISLNKCYIKWNNSYIR